MPPFPFRRRSVRDAAMCSMHAFSRGSTLAVDAGRVALHVYQGRFESHIVLTPERHCSIRLGRPCSCEHACASCVRRSCSSAENFIVPPSVPVDERCGGEPGPPLIAWFAPPGDPGIAKVGACWTLSKRNVDVVVLLVFRLSKPTGTGTGTSLGQLPYARYRSPLHWVPYGSSTS